MLHQEAFDRLSVKYPEAVMVRAMPENALPPTLMDDIFSQHAGRGLVQFGGVPRPQLGACQLSVDGARNLCRREGRLQPPQ